jgi:hypothetical protein
MKDNASSKEPFLRKLFIQILGMFYMFTFLMSFAYLLTHSELITLTFTNIGFAVFLTLANTFFSWARSLDVNTQAEEINNINSISYWSVFGALTFLMTSILLLIINSRSVTSAELFGADIFYTFLIYVRGFLLFVVTAIAFAILFEGYRSIFRFIQQEYIDKK